MSSVTFYKDPMGKAVYEYFSKTSKGKLMVHSMQFDDDEIPIPYLFRSFKEMPKLEQIAIEASKGKVLDVGACAGSHALELQKRNVNVDALEISKACCEVMRQRGVKNVIKGDIFEFSGDTYDTILLLMNGAGIGGDLERFGLLLSKLKKLLNKGGQILLDSSDLKFLYEEEDGSFLIDLNDKYYGEIDFQMEYNTVMSDWFSWLYIDPEILEVCAENQGFKTEIIAEGEHYDYLARLTI